MGALETPPPHEFAVEVVPDRSEVAVVPRGELDLSCADALHDQVRELREAGFDRIVVDLRQLTFLDSTGLRVLLTLHNDAQRGGHALTLIPGPREVQRVFELTGTRGLFAWRAH